MTDTTPTPWTQRALEIRDARGLLLARFELWDLGPQPAVAEANCALAVRAVNERADLIAALRDLVYACTADIDAPPLNKLRDAVERATVLLARDGAR